MFLEFLKVVVIKSVVQILLLSFLYCIIKILEKRRPNGRFFLGPAGSFFPFQSEAWLPQGLRPPPSKVFPSVIKVIVTLEDKIGP